MSAGNFVDTFCAMTLIPGQKWFGRVQPETETAVFGGVANTPPTGPATQLVPFKVSKRDGEPGFRPAIVHGFFPSAVPIGYEVGSPLRIPALNAAATAGAAASINTTTGNTYQGLPFFVTSVTLEDLN